MTVEPPQPEDDDDSDEVPQDRALRDAILAAGSLGQLVLTLPAIKKSAAAARRRGHGRVPGKARRAQRREVATRYGRIPPTTQGETMRYVTKEVDPREATKFLEERAANRNISDGVVAKFAADMVANNWRITGVPVVFNDKGQLIDGQHRMAAIIKANRGVTLTLCQGVTDSEAQRNIDTGRPRPTGQILTMFCGIKNANRTVSVIRHVIQLRLDSTSKMSALSVDAALASLEEMEGVRWVMSTPYAGLSSRRSVAPLLAAFAIAWEKDPTKAASAFTDFHESTFTGAGDPLKALAKYMDTPASTRATDSVRLATARRTLTALSYRFRGVSLSKCYDSIEGMKFFDVHSDPRVRRNKKTKAAS